MISTVYLVLPPVLLKKTEGLLLGWECGGGGFELHPSHMPLDYFPTALWKAQSIQCLSYISVGATKIVTFFYVSVSFNGFGEVLRRGFTKLSFQFLTTYLRLHITIQPQHFDVTLLKEPSQPITRSDLVAEDHDRHSVLAILRHNA